MGSLQLQFQRPASKQYRTKPASKGTATDVDEAFAFPSASEHGTKMFLALTTSACLRIIEANMQRNDGCVVRTPYTDDVSIRVLTSFLAMQGIHAVGIVRIPSRGM